MLNTQKDKKNSASSLNIFDFDHTIYDGDCSLDFYFFCIKQKPSLLRYLPFQFTHYLLFMLRLEDRTKAKSKFFMFLRGLGSTDQYVNNFWETNYKKIKQWYLGADHKQDVIISASPEFLLRPAFNRLGAHTLIATKMDNRNGIIEGRDCQGHDKVVRLKQVFDGVLFSRAYTDNLSDLPILKLAEEKYIVRGDTIYSLEEYQKQPAHKQFSLSLWLTRSKK